MGTMRRIGGMGLWLAGAAAPLLAQAVPAPTVAPPTREEVQRAAGAPAGSAPSRLTVEGGVERAPCPLADARYADVTLTIRGAEFANLRGVPADAMKPAYESLVGRTVPIATICEMRDAAATILRRAGYLAAVQVPPQQIADGVVHFDVLMAKLVRVQVRGRAGRSERLLAAYLDKLVGQPLFNERDAERYLLLARDLPGYDVHLVLRPAGTVPGEVVGEVSVTREAVSLGASVQNYGSGTVGRWGVLVSGQLNDLVGLGDRLTLGVFNTVQVHEQTVLQAGYDVRAGAEGLTLGGRFTYAWTRPDLGGGQHPLKSRTLVGSVEASYPFRRSQATDVRAAAGFDLVNQDLDFFGQSFTRDRLRVAYARIDLVAIDPNSIAGRGGQSAALPRWRLAGTLEARHGTGLLGTSDDCGPSPYTACLIPPSPSRKQGNPQGTLARLSADASFRPMRQVTFVLAPRAQYGFDPLLSYEQYSGGNYSIGRGYDPGAIVGDSGAGATTELRLGDLAPRSRRALAFQAYGFADAAWIWNHDPDSATVRRDRLMSAGGGVRVAWGDRLRADLGAAVPLHKPALQDERGDVRILFSLSTRLLPWSR